MTCDAFIRSARAVTLRRMIAQTALDAILILVIVEAGVLVAWRARTGTGIPLHHLLPNLLAGFCLLLATRLALGDGRPGPVLMAALGGMLFVALVAHLVDLATRWRR